MKLNTIKPNAGEKTSAKRLGRGIGSGLGKTSGKGHKGQKARAGGYHKVGFEGGQMPLQRRLPKVGFKSLKASNSTEVRLHELALLKGDQVSLLTLKEANLVSCAITRVKIILSGKVERAFQVSQDVKATAGAKNAIEAAGGKVEVAA
jgi:large subunit ribosomal protein L15